MSTIEMLRNLLLSAAGPCIEIDPNGDTHIEVGSSYPGPQERPILRVNSRALCRASPVLRRGLSQPEGKVDKASRLASRFGSRLRSRSLEAPTGRHSEAVKHCIILPHEEVLCFSIMMRLAHGQHDRTPRHLTLELLAEVVRIAREYEMMHSLRPVARRWLDSFADGCDFHKIPAGKIKDILYAAWCLGDERIFRESVDKLVRESTADESGGLLHGGSGYPLSPYFTHDSRDISDIHCE